jgi:hypothetical protein
MANPARGEVDLVSETKTYTLFLSTNAVCELQQRTGKTYGQVLRSLEELDFSGLREIVWAVLKKFHRKEFQTVERVGDFIDDVGRNAIQAALLELFTLNLPPKEDEPKAVEGLGRPPAAPDLDGTGANSTSMDATSG